MARARLLLLRTKTGIEHAERPGLAVCPTAAYNGGKRDAFSPDASFAEASYAGAGPIIVHEDSAASRGRSRFSLTCIALKKGYATKWRRWGVWLI